MPMSRKHTKIQEILNIFRAFTKSMFSKKHFIDIEDVSKIKVKMYRTLNRLMKYLDLHFIFRN